MTTRHSISRERPGRSRNRVTLLSVAVLVAIAAACAGGGDASDVSTTTNAAPATTTPTTSTTTTMTLPPIPRQPLTGAVLADAADVIGRPALVVKIDNASGARRNHSGIGRADIVFEEIVEGSITRFAAVFHSDGSDPVGPIRSGRSQDVDMLTSLRKPLFAWSGGNPGVTRLIANSSLVDLNWQTHSGSYYRGAGSTPHNLYSSTDRLWALTPPFVGAPPQQFTYLRPDETFEGEPITGADMAMRGIDVSWDWDAESGAFLRSQEGGPHIDVLNGQISATNVLLMVVEYKPSQIDGRSPEAQTIGNGPLYVLSNGSVMLGRWYRETAEGPIQLLGAKNQPIPITPGNTWIELLEAFPNDDIANPGSTVVIR